MMLLTKFRSRSGATTLNMVTHQWRARHTQADHPQAEVHFIEDLCMWRVLVKFILKVMTEQQKQFCMEIVYFSDCQRARSHAVWSRESTEPLKQVVFSWPVKLDAVSLFDAFSHLVWKLKSNNICILGIRAGTDVAYWHKIFCTCAERVGKDSAHAALFLAIKNKFG